MPQSTWRDDSGDEWQQVPSLNSVASGAGTRRYQLPRALAWPRKTTPPKPQSQAMQGRSLFCGSNCLSNRSQLRTAMGRTWARVIAGHLQEGP